MPAFVQCFDTPGCIQGYRPGIAIIQSPVCGVVAAACQNGITRNRRIFSRPGLAPGENSYAAYQALFMENLPHDASLYNEYHALLVCLGKNVCRARPLCANCYLNVNCRFHKDLQKQETVW